MSIAGRGRVKVVSIPQISSGELMSGELASEYCSAHEKIIIPK